jgi:hypothetical protein
MKSEREIEIERKIEIERERERKRERSTYLQSRLKVATNGAEKEGKLFW